MQTTCEAILKQKIDNYKTMPKCHDSLSMKSEKKTKCNVIYWITENPDSE